MEANTIPPALYFRGNWSPGISMLLYNNACRRDVIKIGTGFYLYKGADGTTINKFKNSDWEEFKASIMDLSMDFK
jgi:hypothetical protein